MQYTQIPPDYAPLGGPLVYAFSDVAPRTFDVSVIDYGVEASVGARRFCDTSSGALDIAPFLRRRLSFRPASGETGGTGFVDAWDRTALAALEIDGIRTPARNFLPLRTAVAAPALLSSMPGYRFIAHGEREELTVLTDRPCTATVEAFRDGRTQTVSYTAPRAGLLLFRLDTAEFPQAELLTVRFDRFAQIVFELTPPRTAGCRVAWRSDSGSLEHYTFPVVKEERTDAERTHIRTEEGLRTGAMLAWRSRTLLSAYEPAGVLEALAEILSSPQVWTVAGSVWTPTEVASDAAGIRRFGSLCNFELRIRTRTSWN